MGLPPSFGADGKQRGLFAESNPSLPGTPSSSSGSNLPPDKTSTAVLNEARQEPAAHYSGFALWLHRITVLMFVFVCASIGVLLVILPWRPEWTDNHLLLGNPGLRAFVANGFIRGICTGLGLLDIWIGFWEAIHYHEVSRP